MSYRSSAAYDLNRYQPKRVEQTPQLQVIENPGVQKKARRLFAVKAVCLILSVAAILGYLLYSKAVLTELGAQINSYNSELQLLESEHSRLQAQLDTQTSLRNVEEYAKQNLNLIQPDQSQIVYMDMGQQDTAQVSQQAQELSFFEQIGMTLSPVLEYLNLK